MSDSPVYGVSSAIESHPCAKCQRPMALTLISTARLAFDVRIFECFNCDNVDKVMTETERVSPFARLSRPFWIDGVRYPLRFALDFGLVVQDRGQQ